MTIAGSVPEKPTVSCGSFVNNGLFSVTWQPVTTLEYDVYRSTSSAVSTFGAALEADVSSPYSVAIPDGMTYYFRLKARNGSGPSVFSDAIEVKRTGSGSKSFTCTNGIP